MPDSILTGEFAAKPLPIPQSFLTGAQMRDLWSAYEGARDAYSEADEERTGAAVNTAQQRILTARTTDPEGNAIKLKVIAERADCSPGLLGNIIEDLSQPQGAPSLVEFAKKLAAAAVPHLEKNDSQVISRAGLVAALTPLIGHFTIADAACAIGFLRTAFDFLKDEIRTDDGIFAVMSILEDFASLADAADADSAAARAHLIQMAAEDDAWDLGPANMQAATKCAKYDVRALRKGIFDTYVRGGTFASTTRTVGWLLAAIENSEGNEASMEYAESFHAARRAAEAGYQQAAE